MLFQPLCFFGAHSSGDEPDQNDPAPAGMEENQDLAAALEEFAGQAFH